MKLLCIVSNLALGGLLAACSTVNTTPAPEVQLDETVAQAQPTFEPIPPTTVVAVPEPLPLPAQLKPLVPESPAAPAERSDPKERVARANDEARVPPTRD